MVKNEEMHYIDSDDQEESVGEKKIMDIKWVVFLKYNIILYFHLVFNINIWNDSLVICKKKFGKIVFFLFFHVYSINSHLLLNDRQCLWMNPLQR